MDNRYGLYLKTKAMIENEPQSTFQMKLNHFADRTEAEKKSLLNMRLGLPEGNGRELQTSCKPGFYLNSRRKCVACSTAGCATCKNNVCSSCLSTKMLFKATTKTCICQTGPMNSTKTDCTTCPSGTAFNVATQTCVKTTTCASGQYWTGTQCAACSANCTSCAALTGACSTCASPFVLSAGKCVCPSGKFLNGTTCDDLNICVAGKYNDGANNCLDCGSNCVSCENVTGKCLTCADTFRIDQSNPKNCANCVFPIGPVDAPVSCVGTAFSAARVIPPY